MFLLEIFHALNHTSRYIKQDTWHCQWLIETMEEVAAEWLSWYENWGKCSCSSAIEFRPPPLPKQPWSGGVSSTLSPVNSLSKYRVSISEVTCGLKGGGIFFCTRSVQLIHEKNTWFMISFASLGPPPNLLLGSFINKPGVEIYAYKFFHSREHDGHDRC